LQTAIEVIRDETKPTKAPRRSLILGLLAVAQLVIVLDFSIVQIALPTIRTQLGISLADSQWIVSAYGLTFAGLLLLSGRMSDLYGRRRLFNIGLIVFALSSLAGGLAPSELVLIAARAVQGVGAAMASATSLSLLVVSFAEGQERNRALSVFSAVQSAAFAAGVILGGVLTASLGWRSIFFINVPIGIVAALLTSRFIVESRDQNASRHLDLPGAVTVTAGLSLLVYALTIAASTSLLSVETLSLLGLAAVALFAFMAIERRSKNPLMPLSFLRRRTVFTANAIAVLLVSTMSSVIFLLTIFLQQLQGFSALDAGLAFVPTAFVFLVGSGFLSARFVTRFGMRPVLIGSMVVLTIGFLLLSRITLGTPYLSALLPWLLVASTGAAFGWTAFYIAGLSGARQGEEGLASGIINTSTQMGGPIGLAIAVTIASVVAIRFTGQIGLSAATVTGFSYAFLADAIMTVIAIIFAAFLRRPSSIAVQAQKAVTVQEPLVVEAPQIRTPTAPTIAQKEEPVGINKILVAVDGSENARRAAETAIKFAKEFQAELIFLRVVTAPTILTPGAQRANSAGIIKQFYDYSERAAKEYLDSAVEEAKKAGVHSAKGEVIRTTSSPAQAIVERANGEKVDLIVVGTRGLSRPERLFLGSVSSGVVAEAEAQVLVVR
jgi:EmrB/QacA subfamily drug resistance transporter